ncbi:LLM class flavin-dependent oxidoreductase [Agromyces atrinae]|uniref:LLM class flavin-dependent oxidoreductase n=1 Tax=Agromyces atrinae TaxID=592376 RepID=UPI001F56C734|nr:LLM class flavin-dependent oxidoreductase [Agromyces atrinae]MCI2956900.1 LLM class flavin-dependent oxidoreductase [Agromyces atrinae]
MNSLAPRSSSRAVGVMLPRDLAADRVIEFARRADALGFDELWVVEDLGFRGGVAQASAVLAATDRIRVGIGILPAAARNAAFAAMEINTLAELFPGRVDVGIGHGMPVWMRQLAAWPASPLTMLREQFGAIRGLLAGEHVETEGRYVTVRGVHLESPAPVTPPLLAGVRGVKSLAVSGEVADGTVLAEPVTPEYIAAARAAIGTEGTGTPHRIVAFNIGSVDDDAAAARDLARPGLEWIGEPDWEPHIRPLPYADEFRAFRAAAESREAFVRDLPDEWVDELAVVGTPDDARARLSELHDAGAHSVVLLPVGADRFAALESLARVL